MKRLLGSSLLVLAASLSIISTPVAARDGGLSTGAAVAIGALGGLAVGGAIGSAAASGPYYPGKPVYSPPPRPVYVAPPRRVHVVEEIEPRCFVKRRRYVDQYGDVIVRRERWCD
jgi:hypothetical protein